MDRYATPVSVGLVVFNGEEFVADAIESILNQTFADLELIVSDNASTDRTGEICQAYRARDARVRYFRNERNIGASENCSRTFHLSRGRYFKWAAHDDVCAPTYLARCVEALDADPSAVLCQTGTRFINADGTLATFDGQSGSFVDKDGRRWFQDRLGRTDSARVSERFTDLLLHGVNSLEIFGVIRRSALEKTALLRRYYASDRALLAELILQGRFVRVPEALFYRRCHRKQASQQPTVADRARVVDPERPEAVRLTGLWNYLAYIAAVRKARMSIVDRAGCYVGLARLAGSPSTLRKVFLPGPYNYFGIGGRRRARA